MVTINRILWSELWIYTGVVAIYQLSHPAISWCRSLNSHFFVFQNKDPKGKKGKKEYYKKIKSRILKLAYCCLTILSNYQCIVCRYLCKEKIQNILTSPHASNTMGTWYTQRNEASE